MSNSEPSPIAAIPINPHTRALLRRNEERREWEEANPELAAAWTAALDEDDRRQRRKETQLFEQKAAERLPDVLVALGVPLRCAEILGEVIDTPALKAAAEWYPKPGSRWLLLMGGVGSGKSVAGAHCVREQVISKLVANPFIDSALLRPRALFVRAAELARTTMSDYSPADRAAFEAWANTDLLVLDDLGAERNWDGWMARLDELLDHRYGAKKRTVITTNLDAKDFETRYGARIYDRIKHDGYAFSAGRESFRQRGLGL